MKEVRAYSEDAAAMYEWFNEQGYSADITALRQEYPGMTSVEEWFERHRGAFVS